MVDTHFELRDGICFSLGCRERCFALIVSKLLDHDAQSDSGRIDGYVEPSAFVVPDSIGCGMNDALKKAKPTPPSIIKTLESTLFEERFELFQQLKILRFAEPRPLGFACARFVNRPCGDLSKINQSRATGQTQKSSTRKHDDEFQTIAFGHSKERWLAFFQ